MWVHPPTCMLRVSWMAGLQNAAACLLLYDVKAQEHTFDCHLLLPQFAVASWPSNSAKSGHLSGIKSQESEERIAMLGHK